MWNQEKPLKITIVWEQNEWGGVDSYLNYLLSDWPCGEDIFTVVYNSENKGAKRLQLSLKNKENINFLEIPSIFEYRPNSKTLSKIYKVLIYLITPLIFVVSSIKYRKIFLNLSPDVVLSQNGGYPGGYGNISAIFGAAWAGVYVRTLVIHHAATKPNYLHGWFRLIMERSLAKVLSSLLTVSEVTKNTILMNTRISDDQVCRIMVIDNGVPISRSAPELNPKKNSDHIVIGILGRLESYKGHEDFLHALYLLSNECLEKIRVRFIGGYEPIDFKRITKLIELLNLEAVVVIEGYIDANISEIICQLDLVAMVTNTFEGFGLTIIEALHNDVPVLTTKVGIAPSLFSENSPLIVNIGDTEGMAAAIKCFISENDKTVFIPTSIKEGLWKYDSRVMSRRYREHLSFEYIKHSVKNLN